jgi:hypothetical protein
MPEVNYTLQIGDDVFKETAMIRRVSSTGELLKVVSEEIIHPMQRRREELGEPVLSLLHVEIVNPYIHPHEWQFTYANKSNLRAYHVCKYCQVTGWIPLNTSMQKTQSHVIRDDKFSKEKFEVCHDVLKQGPKYLFFIS